MGWIATGIAAAGFDNARIQRAFPSVRNDRDLSDCLFWGILCGYGALITELHWGMKYGWSLKRDAVSGWKR